MDRRFTDEQLARAWSNNKKMQAEFKGDFAGYSHFMLTGERITLTAKPRPTIQPKPETKMSEAEQLIQNWKTDPAIRAQYGSFADYLMAAKPQTPGEAALEQIKILQAEAKQKALDPEAIMKAEWNRSAPLQAEFGKFEYYRAYQRAAIAGKAKVHGKKPG